VAEIPPETIVKILELIGRLSILIDRSSAAELAIFNTYGETEEVAYVLEQLDNTRERDSRLHQTYWATVKSIEISTISTNGNGRNVDSIY
jgi:hypothetical protein